MTKSEEPFEMTEANLVLVWPPDRPWRLVIDHGGRLLVFAHPWNAQHVAERIVEEGLRAEAKPVNAEQLAAWTELAPAGEAVEFEDETGLQEDREHARYVAEEFLRRLGAESDR